MIHDQLVDVSVARLLALTPAFRAWEHRPLPGPLHRLVRELDEQTLMTLTAHALRRLTEQGQGARAVG